MKQQVFADKESIDWVFDTHLQDIMDDKGLQYIRRKTVAIVFTGNDDAPDRIECYSENRWDAKPIFAIEPFTMTPEKVWTIPTVYTASYWHRDCDPIGGIVALTPELCEHHTRAAMVDTITTDQQSCDCGADPDCPYCGDDLAWSGVHPCKLSDLLRDLTPSDDYCCIMADLRAQGWAYLSAY